MSEINENTLKNLDNQFPIYLDYNATTPIDEQAQKAMLPYLSTYFGNIEPP
jgi:cysteine desulfurase